MTRHACLAPSLAVLATLLGHAPAVRAQTRWTVDPQASLAWWQVNPNLNHLWATTCPADPEWRPGEGRSAGWNINPNNPNLALPKNGFAGVEDTVHVPLYPRHKVLSDCVEAIRGDITVNDTLHWGGVHGIVAVRGDALFTGEEMRDVIMHQVVLQGAQFPEILFTLDSLVGLTQTGDTVHANAIGTLTVRNVQEPTVAVVTIYPDSGGMRVLAKWHITAKDLMTLTPELHEVGLGISAKIWKSFFMGADIIFRRETAGAN
ncbi:MAG TPA: hypothetical protein VN848_11175 [Gemmatimonadales bacterium]|nr:hypothetical protein [Gemmatimonadales bacterium]